MLSVQILHRRELLLPPALRIEIVKALLPAVYIFNSLEVHSRKSCHIFFKQSEEDRLHSVSFYVITSTSVF